jgi:hypothetical protein
MRRSGLLIAGVLLASSACRTLTTPAPLAALPERNTIIRDQLVIHSDFGLSPDHRLIEELAARRGDVAELLRLPKTEEPIDIYLFNSADTFREFITRHHPELPRRRAFFVKTDTRLAVYAHWGDRVAEDLRHEVAHGYLHAAVPNLPLWLDEGLAEYFEVPRGHHGLNTPHVAQLQATAAQDEWRPNLRRLEALASPGAMTQLDYAESWAWVHFLLETTDERRAVLRDYLQTLRREGAAPPMSVAVRAVHFEPDRTLLEYVNGLPAAD